MSDKQTNRRSFQTDLMTLIMILRAFSIQTSSALALLFLLSFYQANAVPQLELFSTAPAVLDSPVDFSAVLKGAEEYEAGSFVFRWNDNASPAHWKEIISHSNIANLTLTYSSKVYEAQKYKMTVLVYVIKEIYRKKIASATLDFDITKDLNGHLVINGVNSSSRKAVLVSSKNATNIGVAMHDPSGYLDNAKLSYYWFINSSNFGESKDPNFTYMFENPGQSQVEVLVLAKFPDSQHVDVQASSARSPADILSILTPDGIKVGVFTSSLESKRPLQKITVAGNTWMKHGEMLNLTVSCDGSGPWGYCWSIVGSNYNMTGNETCLDPEFISSSCQFPIMWYFRSAGTFDILVQITNTLTVTRKMVHINIYDVHSQTSVTFVVIPVISAIVALGFCFAGFYVFYKFKRDISVEIADFDFNQREDDLERKTFWERLRDSMVNAFQHSSSGDTISHVSSVSSSKSVQQTSGGIHYGSIT